MYHPFNLSMAIIYVGTKTEGLRNCQKSHSWWMMESTFNLLSLSLEV